MVPIPTIYAKGMLKPLRPIPKQGVFTVQIVLPSAHAKSLTPASDITQFLRLAGSLKTDSFVWERHLKTVRKEWDVRPTTLSTLPV